MFLLLVITIITNAQITKVSLQASGLTCSMCNLSIKKSLDKLPFIESINPDIETATYELKFKENAAVNLRDIKNAVTNAGFSVAKLVFSINVKNVISNSINQFKYKEITYNLIEGKLDAAGFNQKFQIVDDGFISDKNFKKYKNKVKGGENVYNLIQTK